MHDAVDSGTVSDCEYHAHAHSNEHHKYLDSLSLKPDEAWEYISRQLTVKEIPLPAKLQPQPPNSIRVVCISDTHGFTDTIDVPDGDVLIHAGDFTNVGLPADVIKFDRWMSTLPHKHKLVIAGNHDLTFDDTFYITHWDHYHERMMDYRKVRSLLRNCTYLEDSGVNIEGYNFYGSPWQPEFGNWAFNARRGIISREKINEIHSYTSLTFQYSGIGPPLGIGDLLHKGTHGGCVDLLRTVRDRVKPLYHIFGHIHEGYGMWMEGETKYLNVSTCTVKYRPTNPAIVFDIPILDHIVSVSSSEQ